MKKKLLLLSIAVLGFATFASADSFTTFATRAAQNPTDIIDWGQLGPDSTFIGSPAAVTSFNGLGAVASVPGSTMVTFVQSCGCGFGSWNGNFDSGENLLYNGAFVNGPSPLTIAFASGVSSVGFEIQDRFFGAFTATLDVFNGANLLFSLTLPGVSNANLDGSALFMGVGDLTAPNITSIVISDVGVGGPSDFAIDAVSLTQATTIPEPGSLALLGTGLLGVAGAIRRKMAR